MAHIIIIGASTGGLPAAYDIREAVGKSHTITVISYSDTFHFVPSNPWVAVGWRTRDEITFKPESYLKKKGIDFIPVPVTRIDPDKNSVTLRDDRTLQYDYLVIATGPKLAFDEVEGLGPNAHTQSICTI
ncbi:MAG: NAD(P)/FAD-dependent oxidoreductase, partial [Gammaproteobacteria bacterium]|nr:NAD(P)/FAD-dependent oxidoreductase [Gammaproteobacteria bacterium]